ncbi:hypothetical protein SKAU_G00085800 [Synaphobranchus kaupii]|uniref:Uncharacterized protein n=1 Tax=Synaphobranchus kaupii TaxID=118154 RepID=A0A9Q1J4X0_SYNKA|nr:hypothetical protein SKAU_G00085800 [Synaphobranchus kaupii]
MCRWGVKEPSREEGGSGCLSGSSLDPRVLPEIILPLLSRGENGTFRRTAERLRPQASPRVNHGAKAPLPQEEERRTTEKLKLFPFRSSSLVARYRGALFILVDLVRGVRPGSLRCPGGTKISSFFCQMQKSVVYRTLWRRPGPGVASTPQARGLHAGTGLSPSWAPRVSHRPENPPGPLTKTGVFVKPFCAPLPSLAPTSNAMRNGTVPTVAAGTNICSSPGSANSPSQQRPLTPENRKERKEAAPEE